jgi:two-component system sensor histidine kinase YesM
MLAYSMVIIVLMTLLSVYSLTVINTYKSQIDGMFDRNILLADTRAVLDKVDGELVSYLNSKSSTSLNLYMLHSEELSDKAVEISEQVVDFSEEELMLLDIVSMIRNYLSEANFAIDDKLKNDVESLSNRYNDTSNIKAYIIDYINELNIRQFGRNAYNYLYMSRQIEKSNMINIVLIIDLILLSIVIVYTMTSNMINPIIRLSHSAEDIAKGRFDTDEIIVERHDEIKILATAFNKMKNSIKTYIEELQTKAETEAKLKDQQVENLQMQSLLDNAKLYALQSQINPHFLYNTINAGVQLAMLEGADRTSEFLESMSRLFRYNIKQIDSDVTLKQELENIIDYYELLKVRFGDLIEFKFIIDEMATGLPMPPLILQPIVENSYIHGLSSREEGGVITIQALKRESHVIIVVSDDGIGMSRVTIQNILSGKHESQAAKSAGIGMRNVIDRLELYYKCKDIFAIKSVQGEGTKIVITIPIDHLNFHKAENRQALT